MKIEEKIADIHMNHLFAASLSMADFVLERLETTSYYDPIGKAAPLRCVDYLRLTHAWLSVFFASGQRKQMVTVSTMRE